MTGPRVARVRASPLNAPLRAPFEIATGSQARVENVLVTVELDDGTRGFGESAPLPAFNGETQAAALAGVRRAALFLAGRPIGTCAALSRELKDRALPASARAGVEMALLDAWARLRGFPLHVYFGGHGDRIATDVTIPIVGPEAASRSAAAIARRGIRALKIKVGKDPEEDAARVLAARDAHPRASLILDGNGGYDARGALRLIRLLKRSGVACDLFEQPVPKDDWDGLGAVSRSGLPVAADESASSLEDVLRLSRAGVAQVINIKLMKSGVLGAVEMARAARATGLGLMIGGMIESRLAMACAAHLAAGFGGFRFVDLDTPLYFASDPMRGPTIGPRGVWDLGPVKGGIGVAPRA